MGYITYTTSCGEMITDAVKNAATIAAKTSLECKLTFNTIELAVSPTSNVKDIITIYDLIMYNNELRSVLQKNGL